MSTIKLENTVQEVEMIIVGLRKAFSMDSVEALVAKIRGQAIPQVQAIQAQQAADAQAAEAQAAQPTDTASPAETPAA